MADGGQVERFVVVSTCGEHRAIAQSRCLGLTGMDIHIYMHTEVEIRFCGCEVICPSTPDFVRSFTFLFSHTHRIRVHAPLILFSHLHFVPSIRIVFPRKHCLLDNFVIIMLMQG